MEKIYYKKDESNGANEPSGAIINTESRGDNIEKKFADNICNSIVNILDINYNDRRIVNSLLQKIIGESIKGRQGLLNQYESYVLDKSSERIVKEFELGDVSINHSYATHAKFADIIKAIKAKK